MDMVIGVGALFFVVAVPILLRNVLSGGWRNRPGAGPGSMRGGNFATFLGINGGRDTNRFASDPEPLLPPEVTD